MLKSKKASFPPPGPLRKSPGSSSFVHTWLCSLSAEPIPPRMLCFKVIQGASVRGLSRAEQTSAIDGVGLPSYFAFISYNFFLS